MTHQYFKEHGARLVELGYRIVPLPPGSKGPRLPGWQKLKATAQDVQRMAANGSRNAGIGVLAATTPAIDVDVMDPEVAQRMSDEIDRIFAGVPLMTRTGMAPKFLIPFRTDQPFRKITSSIYTDGKHEHRIEILGDGQQWVAYHVHPGTGKPYAWFDGLTDDGILALPRESLPDLTVEAARLVVDAFERIAAEMVAAGTWTAKSTVRPETDRGKNTAVDAFDSYAPVTGADVAATLAKIPNADVDYDRWFTVLAAVHHETDGAGRELAYAWSSSSPKHTDERFDTTWNSLGRSGARPVTLRTLLKDVKLKAPPKQFEVQPWGEYKQGFESIPWLIDDVLPQAEFGIIYGASGSGKTFFALDLAAKVARGDEWRGRETLKSRVVYIAAEAGAGIKKRMQAYDLTFGPSPDSPGIIADVPDLQTLDHVDALSQAIGTAGLVIVDTMAASQSGDENSSKDMAVLIMHCKALAASTHAMVLVVHHTGKEDSKGVRGHSSLFAAADVVVEVYKTDEGNGVKVVKQKDGETGETFGFHLEVVKVGSDLKGKTITSCVVREADEAPSKTSSTSGDFDTSKKLERAREFLRVLEEMTDNEPVNVELDAFFEEIRISAEGVGRRFKKSDAANTVRTLAARGKIVQEGRWIRLSGKLRRLAEIGGDLSEHSA